jgi:hypothetical protein
MRHRADQARRILPLFLVMRHRDLFESTLLCFGANEVDSDGGNGEQDCKRAEYRCQSVCIFESRKSRDEASNGQPTDARSHAEAGCTRIRWKYLRHKNLHGVASDLIAKDHWEAGDKQLGVLSTSTKKMAMIPAPMKAVIGVTFRPSRRGFEPLLAPRWPAVARTASTQSTVSWLQCRGTALRLHCPKVTELAAVGAGSECGNLR